MPEATQEQGQFLQTLIKSYDNFQGLGIANYETFTKEVWKRERFHDGKFDREPFDDYLRKLHCSLAPIRGMVGANWTAKTYWLLAEFIMHCSGRYPIWYSEKGKLKSPVLGRIIVANFEIIRDVYEPILDKLLPKNDIKEIVKHPQHKVITRIVFKNNSGFHFMTHEQDIAQYRGWKGKLLGIDEPCPQDKYDESAKGIFLRDGRIVIAATFLDQYMWMVNAFYNKPQYPNSDMEFIYPTIYQNPYNSPEGIERFDRGMTDKRYRASRLFGKPFYLSGLIFPQFSMEAHIIPKFDISGDGFTRYMITDPHSARPTYVAWYATDGKFHYKYNEVEVDSRSYKNIVTAIRDEEMKYLDKNNKPAEISLRVIDPKFAKQPSKEGKTVILSFINAAEEIKYPMTFIDEISDSSIDRGELYIQGMLDYDPQRPISSLNRPIYQIFDNCQLTVDAYTLYGWKRPQEMGEKDHLRRNEKYKHYIDCDRYYFMSNPQHYSIPDSSKRTFEQMRGEREETIQKKGMIRGYNG